MEKISVEEFEKNLYSLNKWAKVFRDKEWAYESELRGIQDEVEKIILGRTQYDIQCSHDHSHWFNQCYNCWMDYNYDKEMSLALYYDPYGDLLPLSELKTASLDKYNKLIELEKRREELLEKVYEFSGEKEEIYAYKNDILTHFLTPLHQAEESFDPFDRRHSYQSFYYFKTRNNSFHLPTNMADFDVITIPLNEPLFVEGPKDEDELLPLEDVMKFAKNYENYELEEDEIISSYPGDEELIEDFLKFLALKFVKLFEKQLETKTFVEINNQVDGCFACERDEDNSPTCEINNIDCLENLFSDLSYIDDLISEKFKNEVIEDYIENSSFKNWMDWRLSGHDSGFLEDVIGFGVFYDNYFEEYYEFLKHHFIAIFLEKLT